MARSMLNRPAPDNPIPPKSEPQSPENNRQRIAQSMKPLGAKGSEKRKVSLRSHLSEPIDRVNRDNARREIGMGILWLTLGTMCAGLGWVLLKILLK